MKYICRKYQHPLNPEAEQLLDLIVDNFYIVSNHYLPKVTVCLDDHKERPSKIITTRLKLKEECDCLKKQLENTRHLYEERCAVEGKQPVDIVNQMSENPSKEEEFVDLDILKIKGLISRINNLQNNIDDHSSFKPDEEFELQTFYSLLGYYDRNGQNGPEVVLLMETLGNQPFNKWIIATTFIHEMMHAMFDHNKTVEKHYSPIIEEPLTEYVTLKFCMNFVKKYPNYNQLYEYAQRSVLSKQTINGISHYGFGYFLHSYEQHYCNILRVKRGEYRYCDWETVFSDAIYLIHRIPTISTYESFFEGWRYPFEKEGECMKELYKVLIEAKQVNVKFKHKVTPPCYLKDVGNLVLSDNDKTLAYCRDLDQEFKVPKGIRTIGMGAFLNNMKMRKVTLPNSVRFINAGSFQNCRNLEYINLPKGIRVIQGGAFGSCKKLKSISLPHTMKIIQRGAFARCSRLETIEIPESLHTIWSFAFGGCSSLKDIKLPQRLSVLGSGAFEGCSSLVSIKIPGTIYGVRESTFSGCQQLKNVEIGDGIISIDKNAFANCTQLESIKIPSSIERIDKYAFWGCDQLKIVTFSGTKSKWELLTNTLPIVDVSHTVYCADGQINIPH